MWKVVNHICQYFPLFAIISRYFPVNATGMANMLICRHFANLVENGKNQLLDASNRYSDSFTIFGLWVLGLAVSNINESQLQTYES